MRIRRYYWLGMHFGRWGVFGGLLFLLLLGALIGLIVWGFTRLASQHHPFVPTGPASGMPPAGWWPPADDALNTARLRYARGELTRDQYFQVVGDLGTGRPAAAAAPPTGPGPVDPAMPGA